MAVSPLAGKLAPAEILIDVQKLEAAYYSIHPNIEDANQIVAFGTSGHRGSSLRGSFNEDHILAIAQAICEYRQQQGCTGPLFIGFDTHALSKPATQTAIEVFAANNVELRVQDGFGFTPTPVISLAILQYNHGRTTGLADGVVVTPSHNPPDEGGFKYNPPTAGPAASDATKAIQDRANELISQGLKGVKRMPYTEALKAPSTQMFDFVTQYVDGLASVIDMPAIAAAGIRIGADPMGGSGVAYWDVIAKKYGLNIQVVNRQVDPTFSFMSVDHDGKIRMDCSSPYAMASLVSLKDQFDIAFGNDTDFDRHGIVTTTGGLMNPNHYLAVAVNYLFTNRPKWNAEVAVGKTLVSSGMIDRVAKKLGRQLYEVPVGFKYFVDGLISGHLGFGGEESAGAAFLRMNGTVWTTEKDGFIMDLLAAEILAKTGRDPAQHHKDLVKQFGEAYYARLDVAATKDQKAALGKLTPDMVTANELCGEKIIARLTNAPGDGSAIGGLKVVTATGWFAARPSGTEDIYKIYAESFKSPADLANIQQQAQNIVLTALNQPAQ